MNKQTTLLTAVLAVGSLLLLSGCAQYKAMRLPQLSQPSYHPKKKGVSLEHKVFDKTDCKTYLGRKNIIKKGYQPIQLTVTNNTDRSYTYSASSLSLPIVPAALVAKKVKFSTAGRVIGYSAAAAGFTSCAVFTFPLWAAITGAACIGMYSGIAALTLITIPAGFCATGFSVSAITDGIKSHKANTELTVDFSDKALPSKGILKPYHIMTGIVFVQKKSFDPNFTFILNDTETNKAVVLSSVSYVDVK